MISGKKRTIPCNPNLEVRGFAIQSLFLWALWFMAVKKPGDGYPKARPFFA